MPTQATRDLVEEFVVETLVDCGAERDHINPSATFEYLEIDSLDMVDLGQSVNKEFQIRLHPKDLEGVKTVGEALDVICATAGLK
ncbi:acyl carrier protein [Streptomyces sp. NPDC057136]|uniref:acyl carrier protein n=1 Tax=Streptomyces sp. NPDC057136 TaxID=3346029 RepID=UPI00363E3D2A